MSTILMTGASGYLGGRMAKALLKSGHSIIALTPAKDNIEPAGNLTVYKLEETNLEDIFKQNKIDGIMHFATCYGRQGETTAKVTEVNVIFPLKLLELAHKNGVKFFINTDTILQPQINAYALTKQQFKMWLNFYCGKITCINMRLDHFYGPFDNSIKFIAFLIENFKRNAPELNLTQGDQTRDFIYVDDVIEAYKTVLNNLDKFTIGKVHQFDVGTGTKISIKDTVLTIKELTDNIITKLNFGAIPYRPHEVLDYTVDNSALKALGWQPSKVFRDGIKEILEQEGTK